MLSRYFSLSSKKNRWKKDDSHTKLSVQHGNQFFIYTGIVFTLRQMLIELLADLKFFYQWIENKACMKSLSLNPRAFFRKNLSFASATNLP